MSVSLNLSIKEIWKIEAYHVGHPTQHLVELRELGLVDEVDVPVGDRVLK